MEQAIQALSLVFSKTLAPDKAIIQQAELELKTLTAQPGYSFTLLQLVAAPAVDTAVRQAAAVSFKNLIKYRWAPSDSDVYSGAQALPDAEKAQIKATLPNLMLGTPPLIQAQLSEALSIICAHDFPRNWPTLLPELVQKLEAGGDVATISGVLATANSIFKRYRNQYSSDAMVQELAGSQEAFAPALLKTQMMLSAQLPQTVDPAALRTLLASVRLVFRIFFSLNAPGLTPLIESQLDQWMAEFHTYLALPDNPALAEADPEKESALDAVRGAACQNINLFMEMNEEEFAKYLQTFVTDVWSLLMKVTLKPGQDNLAMSAIRFLTTVSKSVHHKLFADAATLQQICESIVIPNLRLRDDDQEVFEMNPLEYIRRDAEGSDSDTRRRAAADLVKSLTEKFPSQVTQLFTGYVQAMLAEYAASPAANWKSKDAAIYLVLALTVKGKTASHGATSTNEFVNIQDFFGSQILPELQSPLSADQPILKADAIKFVTTFRSLLPKETLLAVFPLLVALLGSEYNVVHSYAAIAIEKLLSVKDMGQTRLTPADLQSQLAVLFERLFAGFKLPESSENEYLMRAVTRVIGFVGPAVAPVAPVALQELARMLLEVCKNPRNPGFNHYLFESVAALIRHVGSSNPTMIDTFEQLLFPAFNHVLQQDVQEFHPYVFQVFSQLIELRAPPLPAVYLQIFPPLLHPQFWERSGNVPALVRLLQAYLAKAPAEVVSGGHLVAVLGVFQKLLASKAHDHEGFLILGSVVDNLPLTAYEQYLPTIFTLLFSRLQQSRTQKFVRSFMAFLAQFIIKHGPLVTMTSVDKVQPGVFMMLLQQVWLPNLLTLDGAKEVKMALVATGECLTELPPLQADTQTWTSLKETAYKKLGDKDALATGPVAPLEEEVDFEEVQVSGFLLLDFLLDF
uniref:Importin N-terminal domain-containing protein n=1 Tax=Dunaliella tertiolecta TaxID=3047 RepID=A0A7S3VJD6_DUNTE